MTFSDNGTRVRLYPQPPRGTTGTELETVELSSPAGSLGPGPSDDRMYTVIPIGKELPYGLVPGQAGPELYLPPWTGPSVPPPRPSPEGHFDHISPNDPAFPAVHLFGAVRFTLDVWEAYLGEPVRWHFDDDLPRLELTMLEDWPNAHMGYGFLETGTRKGSQGGTYDYALNFDVIAHEVGHAILLSLTGPFRTGEISGDFRAFHEMSSDWVALITSLHFDSVIDNLLANTRGNLDSFNRLSRFGEISQSEQIRLANNNQTMWDYARGWDYEHNLAKPLIGAFFDILVDVYHELLLKHAAVSPSLEMLADRAEREPAMLAIVERGFDRAFARHPDAFRHALIVARDVVAGFLVGLWETADQENFRLEQVLEEMLEIDASSFGGRFAKLINNNLGFRGIGSVRQGPRTQEPSSEDHSHSARMLVPNGLFGCK